MRTGETINEINKNLEINDKIDFAISTIFLMICALRILFSARLITFNGKDYDCAVAF